MRKEEEEKEKKRKKEKKWGDGGREEERKKWNGGNKVGTGWVGVVVVRNGMGRVVYNKLLLDQ